MPNSGKMIRMIGKITIGRTISSQKIKGINLPTTNLTGGSDFLMSFCAGAALNIGRVTFVMRL